MISVVICARIRPFDCIGAPFSGDLSRKPQRLRPLDLATSRPAVSIYGPKGPIIVTWSVGELPSYAPAGRVHADRGGQRLDTWGQSRPLRLSTICRQKDY